MKGKSYLLPKDRREDIGEDSEDDDDEEEKNKNARKNTTDVLNNISIGT